jgi:orotidine-5'-phosphate decarboxylase
MFIDRLIDQIKLKNNPTVVGLDPRIDNIPENIKNKFIKDLGFSYKACSKSIIEFNKRIIDAIYDIVPAVKPQLAYYEMYGVPGIMAFKETCSYARSKGLIVIADGKRNDIGSTSEAYANAYLSDGEVFDDRDEGFFADALTVNPYLGIDGIKPFIDNSIKYGRGIFVLVKTSNKSSGQLQDLVTQSGKTIYETAAELVDEWGSQVIGKYGYSSVGAVVGATYPEQAKKLRSVMKNAYILVPGYGAQGGTANDAAVNFNEDGLGAIVNASRSIIYAYKSERWKEKFNQESFDEAARAEAMRMKKDLINAIGG